MALGFAVVAAIVPEAAAVLAVGGAVVGCYSILAEHLGWPMPAGDVLSPSTWHMHSGKSFDEMSDEEKSASLGNLAGGTAGAIAGGALAEGAIEEPGVPPEEGPLGEPGEDGPLGDDEPPSEPDDDEPSSEPDDEKESPSPPDEDESPEPADDDLPPPEPGGDPNAPPRQPGEPVGSDGLTSDQRAYYRNRVDNASDPEAAQQARYDRNTTARANRGDEPNSPEDWQRQNDQLRQNQSTGSSDENDTLDGLGVPNNNNVTTNPDGTVNRPQTFPKGTDGAETRPDGVTDKALIDNKSAPDTFDADGNPRTVYNDEQLRAQQEAARATGREPVKVITNENPAAVRPSGPLAEDSTVLHRNTADGSWSQWNNETNSGVRSRKIRRVQSFIERRGAPREASTQALDRRHPRGDGW